MNPSNLKSLRKAEIVYVPNKKLKFGVLNCHSLLNSTKDICHAMDVEKISLCALTETWITDYIDDIIAQFYGTEYELLSVPRKENRGGGIGVIYSRTLNIRTVKEIYQRTFEAAEFEITFKNTTVKLLTVYRPPYNSTRGNTVKTFFDDFTHYLSTFLTTSKEVLIV